MAVAAATVAAVKEDEEQEEEQEDQRRAALAGSVTPLGAIMFCKRYQETVQPIKPHEILILTLILCSIFPSPRTRHPPQHSVGCSRRRRLSTQCRTFVFSQPFSRSAPISMRY
jgi:hypothetical protein